MPTSSGLLEGGNLGMIARVVMMGALTDDGVTTRENAAHGGIWRSETDSVTGEIKRALQELIILQSEWHA
jgi:hypothetical protein